MSGVQFSGTSVASQQMKKAFSSFVASFWSEKVLKYFYDTLKDIQDA